MSKTCFTILLALDYIYAEILDDVKKEMYVMKFATSRDRKIRAKLICPKMEDQMVDILSYARGSRVNKKVQNKKLAASL